MTLIGAGTTVQKTAILFDFGHTLFDVRDPGELVAGTALELGFTVDPAAALKTWDEISRVAITPEEMAKERDLSSEAHRSNWVRLFAPLNEIGDGLAEAVYRATISIENWAPYVDSRPVLRALKAAGLSIAVVSDCGFDLRPIFSHHFEGEKLVDEFILSYELGAVKPAPVLFKTALRGLGASAEEAVMVGDNPASDGGSIGVGISALILPPARRGEPRGLDAVLHLAQVHDR